jgi:hypothetical protein
MATFSARISDAIGSVPAAAAVSNVVAAAAVAASSSSSSSSSSSNAAATATASATAGDGVVDVGMARRIYEHALQRGQFDEDAYKFMLALINTDHTSAPERPSGRRKPRFQRGLCMHAVKTYATETIAALYALDPTLAAGPAVVPAPYTGNVKGDDIRRLLKRCAPLCEHGTPVRFNAYEAGLLVVDQLDVLFREHAATSCERLARAIAKQRAEAIAATATKPGLAAREKTLRAVSQAERLLAIWRTAVDAPAMHLQKLHGTAAAAAAATAAAATDDGGAADVLCAVTNAPISRLDAYRIIVPFSEQIIEPVLNVHAASIEAIWTLSHVRSAVNNVLWPWYAHEVAVHKTFTKKTVSAQVDAFLAHAQGGTAVFALFDLADLQLRGALDDLGPGPFDGALENLRLQLMNRLESEGIDTLGAVAAASAAAAAAAADADGDDDEDEDDPIESSSSDDDDDDGSE